MRVLVLYVALLFLAQYNWKLAFAAAALLFIGGWLWQFVDFLGSPRSGGIGAPHQKQISSGVFVTCRCTNGRH